MKVEFWARSGEKFQEKTERLKKWPGFRSEYSSRKFLFLFLLQNFFNLSLLLVSVFCGHFSAARTDLCKGKSRTEFASPEFCLPAVTLNYRDQGFLMLMAKQLALSRSDSKAGSLPI